MDKKIYKVKADRDPSDWMEVEADNAYHAATYYYGACVTRPGVRVTLDAQDIIEVRLGEKICRVPKHVVMSWANWRADENLRKLAESRKKKPWRDPRAGSE